ncbi:hypothetical protein MSAN_01823800 [Mycena sanguinolenta]|uniref:Uncharacterized protein n=1 Tax=Mycena sanguinolenta TaxID=230812 RepID=A0A8H6XUK9_9AGAR|nr:hypothetical protein MSAN_01823800 [Mycena sanguinolenta]
MSTSLTIIQPYLGAAKVRHLQSHPASRHPRPRAPSSGYTVPRALSAPRNPACPCAALKLRPAFRATCPPAHSAPQAGCTHILRLRPPLYLPAAAPNLAIGTRYSLHLLPPHLLTALAAPALAIAAPALAITAASSHRLVPTFGNHSFPLRFIFVPRCPFSIFMDHPLRSIFRL